MDNNILLSGTSVEMTHLRHLPYTLEIRQYLPDHRPYLSTEYGYFSLKAALGALLQYDFSTLQDQGIQLRLVAGNRLICHSDCYPIYSASGVPGPNAIFLDSGIDFRTLRAATGIGFNDEAMLNDATFYLVGIFDEQGKEFKYDDDFVSIRDQVAADQHLQIAARRHLGHRLYYNGEIMAGGESCLFEEVHRFSSGSEAMQYLLLEPYHEFDADISPFPTYNRLHVNVIGPSEERVCGTMLIRIEDAGQDLPMAGLYLAVDGGHEALKEYCGIDFSHTRNFDPSVPNILLARYIYDEGLYLTTDEYLLPLIADIETKDQSSPFTLIYQYDSLRGDDEDISLLNDHYHYRTIEQALIGLLATDLNHFGYVPKALRPSFALEFAAVYDTHDQLAWLEKIPGSGGVEDKVWLALSPRLFNYIPEVFNIVTDSILDAQQSQPIRGAVAIPIAELVTPPMGLPYLQSDVSLLKTLFLMLSGQLRRGENLRLSPEQYAQQSTDHPFCVILYWQSPITEELTQLRLQAASLKDAHQRLLDLEDRIFIKQGPPGKKAFLQRAEILDARSSDALIARRFCSNEDDRTSTNAHLVVYNQHHPDGLRLAAALTESGIAKFQHLDNRDSYEVSEVRKTALYRASRREFVEGRRQNTGLRPG